MPQPRGASTKGSRFSGGTLASSSVGQTRRSFQRGAISRASAPVFTTTTRSALLVYAAVISGRVIKSSGGPRRAEELLRRVTEIHRLSRLSVRSFRPRISRRSCHEHAPKIKPQLRKKGGPPPRPAPCEPFRPVRSRPCPLISRSSGLPPGFRTSRTSRNGPANPCSREALSASRRRGAS